MEERLALICSAALSALLASALFYACVALPAAVNNALLDAFPDYYAAGDFAAAQEAMRDLVTYGEICLCAVIALVLVGFALGKKPLSVGGAISLYLPTFGYFACSMFFWKKRIWRRRLEVGMRGIAAKRLFSSLFQKASQKLPR